MKLRIDVRNAAGVSYGAGPIATATRWTSVRRQDRAGTFGFEMPAGDARAALLAAKRYAHCMGMVNETYTEIGAGIIDRLGVAVGARGGPVLNISGDDLLRELAYRSVGDLELYDVAAAYSTPKQAYYYGPGDDPESPPSDISMDAALDGNTGTHYTDKIYYHGNGEVFGDFIYVGHESRFALTRWVLSGNVNNNSSTLHGAYFSPATGWTEVSGLSDGTASGGATFAQTGDVTWTRPDADDWKPTTHAGIELFWMRFWFTDATSTELDTVDFSEVQIKEEIGSAAPVADIMAQAPTGWSVVDANGDAEESDASAYLLFAGESVLTALMRLAEITGEHFRLGTGKQLVWLTAADASGFRAETGGHGPSLVDNEKVCLILELTKSEDNYEIISRIYPYGAGQGSGRVTLANATNSYGGYTVNTADNYIEYDAAETEIHKVLTWGDIATPDDNAVASERASNQLADAAHEYLSKHIAAQTAYRLRVAKLDGTVYPGQTIRVVYRRFVDGYRAVDIDATLYVLEATTEVGPDGIRTVAMELATTNFWPDSDGGFITSTERRVSRLEAGEQPLGATRIAVQFSNFADIDAGTIDGVVIGGDSPGPGTFTILGVTGSITVGGTVDGVDLAGFNAAQFLTLAASGHMANERILAPGAGLTGTDGGAGAAYTLAVGAGDGIDVAADSVAVDVTDFIDTNYGLTEDTNNIRLKVGSAFTFSTGYLVHNFSGNPTDITPDASANPGDSVYATRTNHLHGITCAAPANPSVDLSASIEGSATSFARSDHEHQLDQAITPTWTGKHIFRHTTQPQVEIGYDAAKYLSITVEGTDDVNISATGNLIKFQSSVAIQSEDYASQTTGWRVTYGGSADFRYLFTDELHAKAFICDLEQALAGGQIISKSVAVLAADFSLPAAGNTLSFTVESFDGFATFRVFVDGDIVRFRQFSRSGTSLTIADAWGTVTWDSTDEEAKTQNYSFTRSAGALAGTAAGVVGQGTLVLDYGTTGNGIIESTCIDGAMAANAPYVQIVNWVTHPQPSANRTVRIRMGNLNGIFSQANEYGLFAGDGHDEGSGDRYMRLSTQAFDIYNLQVQIYDGADLRIHLEPLTPYLAIGAATNYGTGDGIWMGKDTVYKFRVGDVDGERIQWSGTSLELVDADLKLYDGADLRIHIDPTNPSIAIGDTPPTGSDTGTGIWIDAGGMYGLDTDVLQAKFDAETGAITAAAGLVTLDSGGIHIETSTDFVTARSYQFIDGSDNLISSVGAMMTTEGSPVYHYIAVRAFPIAGYQSYVDMHAWAPTTHNATAIMTARSGDVSATFHVVCNDGSSPQTKAVVDADRLDPTGDLTADLGVAEIRWDNVYFNKVNVGTATGATAGQIRHSADRGGAQAEAAGNLHIEDITAKSTAGNSHFTKMFTVTFADDPLDGGTAQKVMGTYTIDVEAKTAIDGCMGIVSFVVVPSNNDAGQQTTGFFHFNSLSDADYINATLLGALQKNNTGVDFTCNVKFRNGGFTLAMTFTSYDVGFADGGTIRAWVDGYTLCALAG